jgi:Cu/Ag efflux protein CusF
MRAMNRRLNSTLVVMVAALAIGACEGGARGERSATGSPSPAIQPSPSLASPAAPAIQTYDIRGTVVAVTLDSGTVNLDHEEIPGLMAAMKMEYQVQDVRMLDGLKPGDRVAGRLQARDGGYVIVALERQPRR